MKTERKSNFELLRIIAMFGIVLYHCYIHSGFTTDTSAVNGVEIIIQVISMFGIVGNVVFTLIAGYFLVNCKDVKKRKIIKIILQVWFYSLLFLIVFKKLNIIDIEVKDVIKNIIPLSYGTNWYITFYFLCYIFSPYINIALRGITKESFKKMLLIMFVVWCLFATINSNLFLNSKFVYYIFIYCIGAYIGLYEKDILISKKKSFIFFVLSILVTVLTIIILHILKLKYVNIYTFGIKRIFRTHQSIFMFFIGLFMFLNFKNINIENNKIINTISSCTLGVYLIHENYFVRKWIWKGFLKLSSIQYEPKVIIYILLSCLILFGICIVIELIRKKTIEKLYMKYIEKNEEKLERCEKKIANLLNKVLVFLGLEKSEKL